MASVNEDGNERRPLLLPSSSSQASNPSLITGISCNTGAPLTGHAYNPSASLASSGLGAGYGTEPCTTAPIASRSLRPNELFMSSTEDELPPPYTPSGLGTVPTIHCKVCQALINLEGRTNSHVVKCDVCQEATPIRTAPPGKKYVRCTCNCLLVCKGNARRVICPRPNCKKTILFGEQTPNSSRDDTNARIICVHCQQTFLFNLTTNALARCPHCRKISSIGRAYSLKRARLFLVLAIVLLVIAIIVTAVTHSKFNVHKGVIAAYLFLYILFVIALMRSLYYYSIRGSQVDDG